MAVEPSRSHPRLDDRLAKVADNSRKLIKASLELLRRPTPDTFLGRETHKPFPREDDE